MSELRVAVRYDLLDRSGAELGLLEGVEPGSGRITRSAAASVKTSASLAVQDLGQVESWLNVRVRPVLTVNDKEIPLGVFLPDVPEWAYTDGSRSARINLLDRLTILDGDSFGSTFGVPAATVVTTAARDIITSTGEPAVGIEDHPAALQSGIEWDPDASKLKIVNEILTAGNFFSLHTGPNGRFRADPYVRPAARPSAATFVDGESATLAQVYRPDFKVSRDIGKIPNRVRVVSQGEGDTEGLFAEAVNTDPADRFSFPNRGFWITHVETEVATTGQAALDAYAERRLIELSEPQETVTISHPPSQVTINDAVEFASSRHDIEGLFTVQRQEWPLRFDGMVTSTLRRVVDL